MELCCCGSAVDFNPDSEIWDLRSGIWDLRSEI
jgi:hypothetical protein